MMAWHPIDILMVAGLMFASYFVGCWAGFQTASKQFNALYANLCKQVAQDKIKQLRPDGDT